MKVMSVTRQTFLPPNRYLAWQRKTQLTRWAIVGLVIGLACFIGYLTATSKLTDKIGVALIAGTAVLYVLLQGNRSYWTLFSIGIATIAIGHHGIYTDKITYFVSLEIIVLALFVVLLIQSVASGEPLGVKMPIAMTFMTIWAVLHATIIFLMIPQGSPDRDPVMAWVTTFAVGFPCFYVVGKMVTQEWQVIRLLKILMVASAIMSIFGMVEYFIPGVTKLLPGLFQRSSFVAQDGFQRAEFSFWGYPAAASIISWGLFVAFDQFTHTKSMFYMAVAVVILVVDSIAVFISGQRSSWIAVVLGLILLNLNLKRRTLILTVVLIFFVAPALPAEFWNRVATLTSFAATGQAADTSVQSRLNRWQRGLDNILANPLTGSGYGGELVHDSVLEIGSRIGLIPAIVFLIFIAQMVWRIFRCYQLPTASARRFGLLFLALSIPWLIQLAIETDLQVQPFAAAQWTFLALAWFSLDIFRPPEVPEELDRVGANHDDIGQLRQLEGRPPDVSPVVKF